MFRRIPLVVHEPIFIYVVVVVKLKCGTTILRTQVLTFILLCFSQRTVGITTATTSLPSSSVH